MSFPAGVQPVMVRFVSDASRLVAASGGLLTVTSGYRSRADQARLYRAFLSGARGLYNVQPPGHSEHEHGRAVDLVVEPRWMLYALGERWQSVGGIWGGTGDPVHFGLR